MGPNERITEAKSVVPLHRQLLPQPDGRGLGPHAQGRCDRAPLGGLEARGLDPDAVRVMAEAGVDISRQRSKSLRELTEADFDYVVTVCDNARESCPLFPGKAKVVHAGFDDPPRLAADAKTDDERLAPIGGCGTRFARLWRHCPVPSNPSSRRSVR